MTTSAKLYTWIDVQDQLEAFFTSEANAARLKNTNYRAYWNGLDVTFCSPKTKESIVSDLETIFLLRYASDSKGKHIILEGGINFPVFINEVAADEIFKISNKPDFTRNSFVGQSIPLTVNKWTTTSNPTLFALHSFKGGVGRTLHAIALALQLSEKGKVLLIDADFEAPGISWLADANISFSDLLALIHSGTDESLIYHLTQTALEENTREDGNLFILPAFRNLKERAPILEIKPEHIFKYQDNPFIVTDIIARIAIKMKIDYVIFDLRAGASELASGWFFDPRINKIFVTSLSSQSVLGTSMMFRLLKKFELKNNINTEELNNPLLIVSQVPQSTIHDLEANWGDLYVDPQLVLYPIRSSYASCFIPLEEYKKGESFSDLTDEQIIGAVMSPLTFFSVENESLKTLPSTWNDVVRLVKLSGLHVDIAKLSSKLTVSELNDISEENLSESRRNLASKAEELIFADTTDENDFLITESIRNLALNFRSSLPIAVVVGAKGSGKTFLYKQIANLNTWHSFCNKVRIPISPGTDAAILPITIPANININKIYNGMLKAFSSNSNNHSSTTIWQDFIKPDIDVSMNTNLTVTNWREKWLDYISWAGGYRTGETGAGRDFMSHLEKNSLKIVAIFDGLEDLFKKFNTNIEQQKALEALLQDVPNWLESQPEKYLGIVVFVRKDIVTAAISQNSGQFFAKHSKYELKWDVEEALRLVHWIINRFKIFKNTTFDSWQDTLREKKESELVPPLYKLWGKKMAKDTSKEAYSHNWILGSLANLKKEVQSRDIVRFLHFAAKKSIDIAGSEKLSDRILFPTPIRESINDVGKEKLEEVSLENEALGNVLNILQSSAKTLEFPCTPEKFHEVIRDEKQIGLLIDNGVLTIYNGEYYMAEIFRKGMDIRYSRKGRPKVLYF